MIDIDINNKSKIDGASFEFPQPTLKKSGIIMNDVGSRNRPYALKRGLGWIYRFGIDFTIKAGESPSGSGSAILEYVTRKGEESPDHTHDTEDEVFCFTPKETSGSRRSEIRPTTSSASGNRPRGREDHEARREPAVGPSPARLHSEAIENAEANAFLQSSKQRPASGFVARL